MLPSVHRSGCLRGTGCCRSWTVLCMMHVVYLCTKIAPMACSVKIHGGRHTMEEARSVTFNSITAEHQGPVERSCLQSHRSHCRPVGSNCNKSVKQMKPGYVSTTIVCSLTRAADWLFFTNVSGKQQQQWPAHYM